MNERTCPDCGCPITNETVCPECGCPIEQYPTPAPSTDTSSTSSPRKIKKKWVIGLIAVLIIGAVIGGIYWNHKQTLERQVAERHQAALDSIAKIERELALQREDSIKRVDFANTFVDVNVFVERTNDESRWGLIDFKSDIDSKLKELGYNVTATDYETRQVEGGDMEKQKITTYEKKWEGEENLWSKVVDDSGMGYIIYFADKANRDRFLESCRDFGYTRKLTLDYDGTPYLAVPIDESHPNYTDMYDLGHCLIYLYNDCVKIEIGGL